MQATHYIEQFRDIRKPDGVVINAPCNPIAQMPASLKRTHSAMVLRTVAVFKIKIKPGVVLANYDYELKTTIVQ